MHSAKLRACGYAIETTFEEAQELGEIAQLFDSQSLRTIRAVRKWTVDKNKVERLFAERDALRKRAERRKNTPWIAKRLREVQDKIYRTMYIRDYVTVVMDHKNHYRHIFESGFTINGIEYRRLSCSAGQARVSTVVFCAADILDEVERRLNNGRDMTKKIAPSKFNAYFGLTSSATFEVTEPRFAVVKDFSNQCTFMANFDTETDWDADDLIEQREVTVDMNRTDGMGLISPRMAAIWANDLGLDYVPGQFIIRQSFLKGMLCAFDFQEFCEKVNNGNYLIDTIYTDENGNSVKADLREVDVIVSESQFKLWDSWKSQQDYVKCYHENGLVWGVASYAPKELKEILRLNYQFIQTLNLKQRDVEALCSQFVDWIEGVSYKDRDYMLLFALGVNNTEESIERFLKSNDKWWIKALIVNPECAKDRYIRTKLKELIRNRIKAGAVGEIYVRGNFQTMISDPYAYMEYVCGLEPKGLLRGGEYYCHYWNERGVQVVDSMRSPLTYRVEHVKAKLVCNEETEHWYQYCKTGFILNWYDNSCVRYAGSDCDGDLVASTDCAAMVRCIYDDELTVTYDAPKPVKKLFTKRDLYDADVFGFGSQIGAITNKGTNAYALLPLLEEEYGKDSEEVKLVTSRLQQCCVAQSKQIDKTKLGQAVKGIPRVWDKRQKITDEDTEEDRKRKEFLNRCLIDRKPYFFKYRYNDTRKEYKAYRSSRDGICRSRFGMGLAELMALPRKTREQAEWLKNYHEFCPVIESNSAMNLVCKYIEQIDFQISERIKAEGEFDPRIYLSGAAMLRIALGEKPECYKAVCDCYDQFVREMRVDREQEDSYLAPAQRLQRLMRDIDSNPYVITDCLVRHLMIENSKRDLDLLWAAYGRYMVRRVTNNRQGAMFPFPDPNGEIVYLGKRYSRKEVNLFE